jgi:hypothetical protein
VGKSSHVVERIIKTRDGKIYDEITDNGIPPVIYLLARDV